MIVVPGGQRGGHERVLRAHHGRLVHEEVARLQAAVGGGEADVALVLDVRAERPEGVQVRIQPAAADHVAARRRQQRRAEAGQQRAADQHAGADRARPARRRPRSSSPRRPAGRRRRRRAARPSRRGPRAARSGPPCRGSAARCGARPPRSVSRQAASSGRAAFLLPAGTTVPDSGTPPSMTNFSIGRSSGGPTRVGPGSWARVPTMSVELSRPEAWSLFCEWTESPSLRRHVLAVEAAHAGLRPALRRGRGAVGHHRPPARPRLRALSRPRDRPSARWRWRSSSGATTRPSWSARSPRTPTSSRSRATRRSRRRLYAVDELSGFIMACAYVRPDGHPRPDAQVGQEEDEDAGLRGRREPRRAARRRRGARRRLRRAPRLRDRRAGGRGRRARAARLVLLGPAAAS